MSGWKTRATRIAYENPWIRVREDDVEGPGGQSLYGVVELRHPAVFVVALDDEDRVCLVTLYRYTIGRDSVEVPAGGTDGDEPLVAAQREFREEAGCDADEWTKLGVITSLNGITDLHLHVYLARGVTPSAGARAEEEGISEVAWVPLDEVWDRVLAGGIDDGESIAALGMATAHLRRSRRD